jgi:hypothetical protein
VELSFDDIVFRVFTNAEGIAIDRTMAEIEDMTLRLSSCGSPYPLHFHDGEGGALPGR